MPWGAPCLGLFPNEGATVFGGYSLGRGRELATVGHLSNLWDGKPIERTRGVKNESMKLFNKRLAANIMVQSIVFEKIWNNQLFQRQGILARFLISKPTPMIGTRTMHERAPVITHKLPFHNRVRKLLEELDAQGPPVDIELSEEAKSINREFYQLIENESGIGKKYRSVSVFAAKIAEQARRIAGVIACFENSETVFISGELMERGRDLAMWYLDEVLRIYDNENLNEKIDNTNRLLNLLTKKKKLTVREICQLFPSKSMRKVSQITPLLDVLEKQNKVVRDGNIWKAII